MKFVPGDLIKIKYLWMTTDVYLFIASVKASDACLKMGEVDRFPLPADDNWMYVLGNDGFSLKNPIFYVLANSEQQ